MSEKEKPKGDKIRWYRMSFESGTPTRVIRLRGDYAAVNEREAIMVASAFAKDHNLSGFSGIEDVTDEVTRKKVEKD